MDTTALNGPGGLTAAALPKPDNKSVEKESFLKLLVAQISNQDPMAPQESQQYLDQLTQFSTLEQLMNLNDNVSNLAVGQLSNNSQEALRFVGREITAKGDRLQLGEGPVSLRYAADEAATSLTVSVYDADGDLVREQTMPRTPGQDTWEWDGTDDQGVPQPPGTYRVMVEVADADGNPRPVDTFVRGRVTGIRFDEGFPELLVGDRRVRLGEVTEVM